tara:strand:- start:744 stop:1133 length:390 start_codon:yes stop_codon:yes gene_type:complete
LYKKNFEKNMIKKFDWKKKSAVFIGRFQPFHDGHKNVFLNILKKNGQVTILVMDSYGINKKNPFKFNYVKKKILSSLRNYRGKFKIIKIPVVSEVVCGRKVGYKFRKVKLSKVLENISATKIRKKIYTK